MILYHNLLNISLLIHIPKILLFFCNHQQSCHKSKHLPLMDLHRYFWSLTFRILGTWICIAKNLKYIARWPFQKSQGFLFPPTLLKTACFLVYWPTLKLSITLLTNISEKIYDYVFIAFPIFFKTCAMPFHGFFWRHTFFEDCLFIVFTHSLSYWLVGTDDVIWILELH